jgi:HD-GYP domain-containing protein (c-di-GMP phosphodiesterase class II)
MARHRGNADELSVKKQVLTLVACTGLAAACQTLTAVWPAPANAETTLPFALAAATAALALLFGAVMAYVAWKAAAWSPVLLALGTISISAGVVARFCFSGSGLALLANANAAYLPAMGYLAGGACFFLAVQSFLPAAPGQAARSRTALIAGSAATVALCIAIAAVPALRPHDELARTLAGLGAPGYLYAAYRFGQSWRPMRLPSQLVMAIASVALAPAGAIAAVGGVPNVAAWQAELALTAIAALPVCAFVIEQRSRPGLRSLVFGLLLPRSVSPAGGDDARDLTPLMESVAGHEGPMAGHVARVTELATRIALSLGLDAATVQEVTLTSQLHDIGNIFVPRELLTKSRHLGERENALAQAQAVRGAEIVRRIPPFAAAAHGVGEQYERWGGGGYPNGLLGEQITGAARIVAVADAYDTLRSVRAYKREWGVGEALSQIERGAGADFEPRVVHALLRLVANGGAGAAVRGAHSRVAA